jgi:hypothetical protein
MTDGESASAYPRTRVDTIAWTGWNPGATPFDSHTVRPVASTGD